MKKPNLQHLLCILLLTALLVTAFALPGLADAGNFSGGSDYGGSGGYSGGYSGGSDWGYSGSYHSSDSDYDGDISPFWLVIAAVILVIMLLSSKKKKKKKYVPPKNIRTPSAAPGNTLNLSVLKEKDPNFSERELLDDCCNHYMQMQNAWEKKDWEPMRAILSDALYNQMARQLQELIDKKRTNHVDNIMVQSAQIRRYAQEQDNDILTVRLSVRINDYVTDDTTDKLISGSPTTDLYMVYDWTLTRSKDRKTRDKEAFTQVECAHCGAPLSIKQSGRCEYCGSVITLADHDWVLTNIEGISRRSAN